MELLQLRYFRTAALEENFSRAAEIHLVPQSAISKTIRKLENELGCKLFDRNGKKICLNENGKLFLKKIDIALKNIDSAISEVKVNELKIIGITVFSGIHFMSKLVEDFEKEFENYKIVFFDGESSMDKESDFYFHQLPINEEVYDYKILMEDEIKVAISNNNRLSKREFLELSQLENEKFIFFEPSTKLREFTDSLFVNQSYKPNIVFDSTSLKAFRSMVEANQGITLVPSVSWNQEPSRHVTLVPLKEHPARTLVIAWKKDKEITSEYRTFIDYSEKWFNTQTQKSL